ncbi:hypothetical protein [Roseovarius aestuariivivens]|uniref:hypothetical protein n=1 Tax=Roseovarius aestuariivivens TaxID=1888910 RepID=UPI0010801A45|nr:hypothetical protein [Roseovarius aestuariivivens]
MSWRFFCMSNPVYWLGERAFPISTNCAMFNNRLGKSALHSRTGFFALAIALEAILLHQYQAGLSATRTSRAEISLRFERTAVFLAALRLRRRSISMLHLRASAKEHFRYGLLSVI